MRGLKKIYNERGHIDIYIHGHYDYPLGRVGENWPDQIYTRATIYQISCCHISDTRKKAIFFRVMCFKYFWYVWDNLITENSHQWYVENKAKYKRKLKRHFFLFFFLYILKIK